MALLHEVERDKYAELWGSVDAYGHGSPGERHVDLFLDMAETRLAESILDAGCGSGKGAIALRARGFADLTLCDLTDEGVAPAAQALPFITACLWSNLARQVGHRDWVYCCDVMEHIPPAFVALTLQRLLDVSRRGVFLSIALTPDNFGAWVGAHLHQSVFPFVWWRDLLRELGTVRECRDLQGVGVYLVEPRL